MTDEAPQRRPFHESVVDAIKRSYRVELHHLALLIKETSIPRGHDEVIAAWRKASDADDLYGVVTNLLKQKEEAEEKAAAKEPVSS